MKPSREFWMMLVLNTLAAFLCVVLGCRSVEKSRERVWHNGQWVDRIELEK